MFSQLFRSDQVINLKKNIHQVESVLEGCQVVESSKESDELFVRSQNQTSRCHGSRPRILFFVSAR